MSPTWDNALEAPGTKLPIRMEKSPEAFGGRAAWNLGVFLIFVIAAGDYPA